MAGPKGTHNNQDTFDGARPATGAIAPPKQINGGDAKLGPRKASPAFPNHQDTFSE